MSDQLQLRRGTASQVAAFTPAQGECVVDTTNNRICVGDGATAGGWPAAKLGEAVTNTRIAVSDANYTALITDRTIAYTALTAARTVTLPAAASYPTGTRLLVVDESGNASGLLTITLVASGSDTVNGMATIKSAYACVSLESNGSNKWTSIDHTSIQLQPTLCQGLYGANITATVAETLVTLSGASTNASLQIPANCIVLAVGAYVTTAITGATSYEVGVAGNLSQFGSLLSIAAGSINYGLIGPTAFYAATTLTITAAGGSFTGGAVRLSIHYLTCGPSTS